MKTVLFVALVAFTLTFLPACTPPRADHIPGEFLPVLAYHSVMPPNYFYPNHVDNPWVIPVEMFREQMQYLYDNGFNTLTAQQVIDFMYYDGVLPPNPVLLTFDDGYLDNALYAAPILREFGFTAILFVLTGSLSDAPPVMSPRLPYLSVYEMAATADVFEFASHSHNLHHMVGNLGALEVATTEEVRADLRASFAYPLTLRTAFAYPFGRHGPAALEALEAEGVRIAFTTEWGYAYRSNPPLLLPRFSVVDDAFWRETTFFSRIVRGDR